MDVRKLVMRLGALLTSLSLHLYQSPQHSGALTILSLQQNLVSFTTATGGQGHCNLLTDDYQS